MIDLNRSADPQLSGMHHMSNDALSEPVNYVYRLNKNDKIRANKC
jgi:hypothetical protein